MPYDDPKKPALAVVLMLLGWLAIFVAVGLALEAIPLQLAVRALHGGVDNLLLAGEANSVANRIGIC